MQAHQKILVAFASLLVGVGSALAYDNDLSISGDDVVVNPSALVEGQNAKIYTTVRNLGIVDLLGTVKFYIDGVQISSDQPVSVKTGGVPDEVFVNWETQGGNHTVGVKIFPYESEGDDPGNNYAETSIYVDYDSDGDGVGDSVDVDDDNDGLSDEEEDSLGTNSKISDTDRDGVGDKSDVFPLDASESQDSDGDGIGDNADLDDDNDGLPDTAEAQIGTDPLNPDTDGDGLEKCNDLLDKFPLQPLECTDSDGDGCGDNSDSNPNDASICSDCDGDGVANSRDEDDDNDGHLDTEDALPCDPLEWQDSDNDGLGDNADPNDNNQGPIPIFEGDRVAIIHEEVNFDGSKSIDADGTISAYLWDFGDGSEFSENQSVNHIYDKVGEYIVKLKVTDDKGESRTKEAIVVVENSPWLENALLSLMVLLLLIFIYIFWNTVQQKKKKHHHG